MPKKKNTVTKEEPAVREDKWQRERTAVIEKLQKQGYDVGYEEGILLFRVSRKDYLDEAKNSEIKSAVKKTGYVSSFGIRPKK